jgi:hypothetical protein
MTPEEEQKLLNYFQRAVEYSERLTQIIEQNLDIAEELPLNTKEEASAMLAQYQDLDSEFYENLLKKLTTEPDYHLTEEAYSKARKADLLRRRDEILRDYEELHQDTELVQFLKTDFYYEVATFEWRALMMVLQGQDPNDTEI